MTPTPPSATTSTSGHSPEEQYRIVRRRNRVPLSCHPCRTRKLKCNRAHPFCENCIKRGDTQSCAYAAPTSRKKTHESNGANPTPDDMQNRIDRLEGLVLSLMHGGANVDPAALAAAAGASGAARHSTSASAPSTTDSSSFVRVERDSDAMQDDDQDGESEDDDGLATSVGFLKIDADKGKSMYIGQEHWHTLLADISEVKSFFNSHKKDLESTYERVAQSKPPTARDSPIFLLSAPPATEIELRSELPSRSAVMTMVSRYFNSHDSSSSIIHGPTFQDQLRRHWQDPSSSSVVWIGLLYSILCLAMLSYSRVGDEPPEWKGRALELASEYRLRTVQCLVLADFTKPREYTVETLLLYLFGEFSSRYDADVAFWVISSTIVRLAMRQGYHRDGKLFPSMSPFQAEMRRRVWALIRMADIMFSHQLSLPTMIFERDTDTELPRLIFDEEFGPDTKVLPPSRPITEPTPIAYQVGKAKMCFELGNILQTITRLNPPVTYDEILASDARLRDAHAELPPHLKMQPLENSQDPVTLLLARLNLNFLYCKIMCILHRKHLMLARNNPRYAHSRRSAIESASETLELFQCVYRECEPDGRLRMHKWYVGSVSRDTLLATMLILMEIHGDEQSAASGKRQDSQAQALFFWTPEQRQEMIKSVNGVREIWKKLSSETVEAYKAINIIDIMMAKITKTEKKDNPEVPMAENIFPGFSESTAKPEQSAAMTLGMMSSGLTPNANFSDPSGMFTPMEVANTNGMMPDFTGDLQQASSGPFSPFSMFTNLPNGGSDGMDQGIDWNAFDTIAQNVDWPTDMSAWNLSFFGGGTGGESQQQSQGPQGGSTQTNMPFMGATNNGAPMG